MDTETSKPFAGRYALVMGLVLSLVGVVETFATPDPGSYFGPAMLVFGPSMLLLWWSGRTGNAALRVAANVLGGVAVAIALVDIALDLLS